MGQATVNAKAGDRRSHANRFPAPPTVDRRVPSWIDGAVERIALLLLRAAGNQTPTASTRPRRRQCAGRTAFRPGGAHSSPVDVRRTIFAGVLVSCERLALPKSAFASGDCCSAKSNHAHNGNAASKTDAEHAAHHASNSVNPSAFHALRVAYTTFLFDCGTDAKTAQSLARHSTPSLTMNTYARARSDRLSEAVEAVGNAIMPQKCATGVHLKVVGGENELANNCTVNALQEIKTTEREGFEPPNVLLR